MQSRLAPVSDSSSLDAQVLLAHILDKPRAWIMAHPEAILTPDQEEALCADLERLEKGEALPYVLGKWEFYGLDFLVTREVLIPRPETELLVEQALAWLRSHPGRSALDVGAGSGCIAVTLAAGIPDLRVLACDIAWPALEITCKNARLHGVQGRLSCVQADLFPPVARPFDLICANLPYIPTEKLDSLDVTRREPRLALDGGRLGLELIERLIREAPDKLADCGLLLLEIEASQGEAVRRLAQQAFPSAEVSLLADLAGHDRLVRVQRP